MSIASVVLKLEGGGQIDPLQGVTGSKNSQSGIELKDSKWYRHKVVLYQLERCSVNIAWSQNFSTLAFDVVPSF